MDGCRRVRLSGIKREINPEMYCIYLMKRIPAAAMSSKKGIGRLKCLT